MPGKYFLASSIFLIISDARMFLSVVGHWPLGSIADFYMFMMFSPLIGLGLLILGVINIYKKKQSYRKS